MTGARAIKIAVTALGGQGGGVLSDWIVQLGEANGFVAQSTSVPGVAQRTGATVYYVELFPLEAAQRAGKPPVLALMPAPGDVDIVIAAEMMEAGRAILRGFVSGQTTLIASSHRDYAIYEKIVPGDGRRETDSIIEAAQKTAKRFIAAAETGSVISAALFGALAGSGALPFTQQQFEETIRASGRAVETNLAGFRKGAALAQAGARPEALAEPQAQTVANFKDFPPSAQFFLKEGFTRAVDYLDRRYGETYLERVRAVMAVDRAAGGATRDYRLTATVAKYLATAMTYEDVIRVADLKTRGARFERFRDDVKAAPGQIVHVSEFMHPRVEEVCDLLSPGLARAIEGSAFLSRTLKGVLGEGRRVSTTKLRGFLLLHSLGGMRFLRRGGRRFQQETRRLQDWLALVSEEASRDYALSVELAALRRVVKGYGETHERGLEKYGAIVAALDAVRAGDDPAARLRGLVAAALKDEEGAALKAAIGALGRGKAA